MQDNMPQMPMPQDNESQEATQLDMIKQALMKVIDDMTALESDNHLPDGHPMKKMPVTSMPDASPDSDMSGTSPADPAEDDDSSSLDMLMGEADKADADGGMPEDKTSDLPPEIMDVVNKKKAEMGK